MMGRNIPNIKPEYSGIAFQKKENVSLNASQNVLKCMISFLIGNLKWEKPLLKNL
jgi:hypothetical protein